MPDTSDTVRPIERIAAVLLAVFPLTLGSVGLLYLQSQAGVEWAYSLFDTAHILNFGGNPAEVYSHLLNWIVMTGGIVSLCAAWISTLLAGSNARPPRIFHPIPPIMFFLTVVVLATWASILDGKNGEGTVLWSFVLFFAPCIALHAGASYCYLFFKLETWLQILACIGVLVMAVQFQWHYQRSGTGGPNFLVFPLLVIQVAGHWLPAFWLMRRNRLAKRNRQIHRG